MIKIFKFSSHRQSHDVVRPLVTSRGILKDLNFLLITFNLKIKALSLSPNSRCVYTDCNVLYIVSLACFLSKYKLGLPSNAGQSTVAGSLKSYDHNILMFTQ